MKKVIIGGIFSVIVAVVTGVFSGVDITNAKIVRIEQSGAHGWGIHAVISDAYFYNE